MDKSNNSTNDKTGISSLNCRGNCQQGMVTLDQNVQWEIC